MIKHPPASPGFPPSGITNDMAARDAWRKRHPAKLGRPSVKSTTELIEAAMSKVNTPPDRMDAVTKQVAVELERSPDAVKTAIKSAREALAKRAEEYVDLHFMGAQKAVDRGDTRPVEWALEHISDGKDRVVDAPSKAQLEPGDKRPHIQIGIVLGGMPKPKAELPADARTVPIDVEVSE